MRLVVTTPKTDHPCHENVRKALLLVFLFVISGIQIANQSQIVEENEEERFLTRWRSS